MKIPPCEVCGVDLRLHKKNRRVAGRVLISQKGKRDKPKGYCFAHAHKWSDKENRLVTYQEEKR